MKSGMSLVDRLTAQSPPGMAPREDAKRSLEGLKSALAAVVAAVPGNVRKAADLQHALGLDATLGWLVFRVATAEEPLAALPYVPKASAVARFLRAAHREGVPSTLIERAEQELSRFDEVVQRHADDREAFDAMLGGRETDLKDRRAAFRLSSRLWGEQCKARLSTTIVLPGLREGMYDAVFVRGFMDVVKTRDGSAGSRVLRFRMWPGTDDHLEKDDQLWVSPLEGDPNDPYAGILKDFSSTSLPKVQRFTDENGFACSEISIEQIGKTGATTYFVAEKMYNFCRSPLAMTHSDAFSIYIREPVEVFVRDFLVHESVWDGSPPSVAMHGFLDPVDLAHRPLFSDANRLWCGERLVELSRGVDALYSPDVPRYPELAERVFALAGLNANQFRTFRCRVEYPILHTTLRVVFGPRKNDGN